MSNKQLYKPWLNTQGRRNHPHWPSRVGASLLKGKWVSQQSVLPSSNIKSRSLCQISPAALFVPIFHGPSSIIPTALCTQVLHAIIQSYPVRNLLCFPVQQRLGNPLLLIKNKKTAQRNKKKNLKKKAVIWKTKLQTKRGGSAAAENLGVFRKPFFALSYKSAFCHKITLATLMSIFVLTLLNPRRKLTQQIKNKSLTLRTALTWKRKKSETFMKPTKAFTIPYYLEDDQIPLW